MQKELEAHEDEKAAEIEASSSALKQKRALVEARMKQEEEEIKSLSEAAKREASGSCDIFRSKVLPPAYQCRHFPILFRPNFAV